MEDRIQSAFAEIRADNALIESTAACLNREAEKRRNRKKNYALPRFAAAFAAVLVICVFARNLYFSADAYVSIDINPSVELTLNRFGRVIGTYAFNADGERILSEVSLFGKTFDEAAELIISAVEADGYLTEAALVSVTVRAGSGSREQVLCDALQRSIDEQVLFAQETAEVEIFPVTAEVWDSAHGCNMSPAKYLAIQELMTVDAEATIEAYSNSTISEIRLRTRECRNAHNSETGGNNSGSGEGNQGHGSGQGNGQGNGHKGGH